MIEHSWAHGDWPASHQAAAAELSALCGIELSHQFPPLSSGAVSGEPWKFTVGKGTANYAALFLRPNQRPWTLVAGIGTYTTLSAQPSHAIAMMLFEGKLFRAGKKYAQLVSDWPRIKGLLEQVDEELDVDAMNTAVALTDWGTIRGYDHTNPFVQDGFAHHLKVLDPDPDRLLAVNWGRTAIDAAMSGSQVPSPPVLSSLEYRPYLEAMAFRLLPDCERRRQAAFYVLTRSITVDSSQPVEGTLWPTPSRKHMLDLVHRASEYLASVGPPSDAMEHPLATVVGRIHEDIAQVHSDPYLAASAELARSDPQASWDHLMMAGVFAKFADAPMSVLENFIGAAAALAARLGDDELAQLYRSS